MRTYIYFVADGEFTKVGIAKNPERRLANLQVGNPRQLALVGNFRLFTLDEARRMETTMHVALGERDLYVLGEWYRIEASAAIALYHTFKPGPVPKRAPKASKPRQGWSRNPLSERPAPL